MWHCCIECEVGIRELILSGEVAAPPAPATGSVERDDAGERVLQDEMRTRGGGGGRARSLRNSVAPKGR